MNYSYGFHPGIPEVLYQTMLFKKRPNPEIMEINGLQFEVTRKRIRHLYLRILAKDRSLKISAPMGTSEREIRRFVEVKFPWIQKKMKKFENRKQEPEFQYVDGEQIPIWGKTFELRLLRGGIATKAYTHINIMMLNVRGTSTVEKREKAVETFYREEVKREVDRLIKKWEPVIGVKVAEFGVKKMKTRWGTCNIRDRRIWLNLRLAKYDPKALELVVVHEMVHLLERLHNKRFYNFMDEFLPDWKQRSMELDGRVC